MANNTSLVGKMKKQANFVRQIITMSQKIIRNIGMLGVQEFIIFSMRITKKICGEREITNLKNSVIYEASTS